MHVPRNRIAHLLEGAQKRELEERLERERPAPAGTAVSRVRRARLEVDLELTDGQLAILRERLARGEIHITDAAVLASSYRLRFW